MDCRKLNNGVQKRLTVVWPRRINEPLFVRAKVATDDRPPHIICVDRLHPFPAMRVVQSYSCVWEVTGRFCSVTNLYKQTYKHLRLHWRGHKRYHSGVWLCDNSCSEGDAGWYAYGPPLSWQPSWSCRDFYLPAYRAGQFPSDVLSPSQEVHTCLRIWWAENFVESELLPVTETISVCKEWF